MALRSAPMLIPKPEPGTATHHVHMTTFAAELHTGAAAIGRRRSDAQEFSSGFFNFEVALYHRMNRHWLFTRLLRAHAAIDGQRVAGNVTRLVGQQPHHGVGNLVWLADSPHRHESGIAVRVAACPFRE